MIFISFLMVFIVLVALMVIHEFGHFVLAKKFGVKVEEFGIGYPPRLWAKKISETVYSLNLIPFGAFVRLPDEDTVEVGQKYANQPIWKKMLIALGGVFSFWIIAALLLGMIFMNGTQLSIADSESGNLQNVEVIITRVFLDSPAATAGLKAGDVIVKMEIGDKQQEISQVKEVQDFVAGHAGEKIAMTIKRGNSSFRTDVVLRQSPPTGEGLLGIGLDRTAFKRFPWPTALWQGIYTTGVYTRAILAGYSQALANIFSGKPSGIELTGIVGIGHMGIEALQLGLVNFILFVALISIYMAIFNALPIPVVDGGKVLFLIIEAVRRRPLKPELEQKIDTVAFAILIGLMVLVTIKDVINLF